MAQKDSEAYVELVAHLQDLLKKWLANCNTMEVVCKKLVIEQLLNYMPVDLRAWVKEWKPVTGKAAGQLADDYVLTRRKDLMIPTFQKTMIGHKMCHARGVESTGSRLPSGEVNGYHCQAVRRSKEVVQETYQVLQLQLGWTHGHAVPRQCIVLWRRGNARSS